MFDPEKKTKNPVHIADFDGETIEKMVQFIYTDEIAGGKSGIDMELLAIAHKYNIHPLQTLCEDVLSQQLDVDNVLDALVCANTFQAAILKDACQCYLEHHWEEIAKTKEFQQMFDTNAKLLLQTTVKCYEELRKNSKNKTGDEAVQNIGKPK